MKGARALLVFAGATVIVATGVTLGAWWLTFPAGLAIGLVLARARWAIVAGGAAGLLGWVLLLGWEQAQYGLGPTASSLAAIMGFTGATVAPVILTCLVGLLLGLTGAWLGSAVRAMLVKGAPPTQPSPQGGEETS